MQVLIFKLAHLLPATQGRMDTEAGARMQVSQIRRCACASASQLSLEMLENARISKSGLQSRRWVLHRLSEWTLLPWAHPPD